jgi:predicted 3-demethylubiquinone-9 3-methyltransferase (glyoxalase superfamily)
MDKIIPNLWFDKNAEEAANFYVSLFSNSKVNAVHRSAADNPSTKKGEILLVDFTLSGRNYVGINGGPHFTFNEAVSFQIDCEDQTEVDYYWDALTGNGGSEVQCGWCKDRFGVSWQVVPRRLGELLTNSDAATAERTMKAMMEMVKLDVAALEAAARG